MDAQTIAGNVLSASGWRYGTIGIQQNRISFVPRTPGDPDTNDDVLIIPGFIDLHVHGAGGADAGMPDGEYRLGRQRVTKALGCVRLADGTLAGSTLTLDQGLRNLVNLGFSIEEASARVSRYPADYLGLQDRGRIESGAWADLVVLDRELRPIAVYVEGEPVEPIPS